MRDLSAAAWRKSSYSHAGGNCVEVAVLGPAAWRKSSYSTSGDNCVEVAPLGDGRIAVRDSKHPADGVILLTRTEMHAWIKGIKTGEFGDLT